jgi:SNF2 family DNA or RNA helicase
VVALVVDSHFRTINFTHKTLLVCRSNNKRSTWKYHLDKYTKLNYIIIEGTKAQRLDAIEQFKKYKDLAIIHYEGMRLHKEELVGIPDLVIIDEAQAISNFESQQSQVADKISEKAKYTLLLSGGVAQNRVAKQLWLPLKLLDRKSWPSYQLWVRDWCTIEEIFVPLFVKGKKVINWQTKKIVTRKINQVTGIKDPEALAVAVTPYIYQKRKEDVGEQLPEKIYQIIETGLYTKQRELYRKIRDEVATQIKGMTINNSLVKLLRLYQTCATLAYFDMDDISSKADEAVEEILNIPPDTKALVFSQFVQLCNGVYKRLKKEGVNVAIITGESSTTKGDTRDNIRKEFKEGGTNVLIATTMIEGTGSSYKEASYLFRLDRMAAVLLNEQSDDRIVRLDSAHKTVNIIDFVSRNTIEEIQLEILKEKMTDIKNVFTPAYEYNMSDIQRMLDILPKGD